MKGQIFYFPLLVTILMSCNSGASKKVNNEQDPFLLPYNIDLGKNVNIKSLPLSTIGKKIEYIPLETTPNSLLGSLNGIGLDLANIEFSDSFIFISDGEKLLQFDRSGKFIKQIGSIGRGPGQYLQPYDFCIDEKNMKIYILNGSSVMEFNFNGEFKKSTKYEWFSALFSLVDTANFIFYKANKPAKTNDMVYSWYITDLQCTPQKKIINFHKRVNVPGAGIAWTPLYTFNKDVHFMEYCADTLFFLNKGTLEPYAVYNFGNLKLEPDPAPSSDRKEYYDRLNQKLWARFINENDKCIFLTLWWGHSDSAKYCVYNKQSLQTTFLKNKSFSNDLDGGPSFWPRYIYNDNTLVDFIYTEKLLEHINKKNASQSISSELKALGQQITETSNPILMVLQ